LYLIDVDECSDIYGPLSPNYRKLLLNPNDRTGFSRFREDQKNLFETHLQDALYDYRNSLTTERRHQERYIRAFFSRMGWQSPSEGDIDRITQFGEGYQTLEQYIGSMTDE